MNADYILAIRHTKWANERLGLPVGELRDIPSSHKPIEGRLQIPHLNRIIAESIRDDGIRLPDDFRNRGSRVDSLGELDIMSIHLDTICGRAILRMTNLHAELLKSFTKIVFRSVAILIDFGKRLRDCVDGNADSITQHSRSFS